MENFKFFFIISERVTIGSIIQKLSANKLIERKKILSRIERKDCKK
jgi:hypothetical protein